MTTPKILSAIHYLDQATTFTEVETSASCGAGGVFLIPHHGNDEKLLKVNLTVKKKNPGFPIGINFLSTGSLDAARIATAFAFPMFWDDDLSVDSNDLTAPRAAILFGLRPGITPQQIY